MMAHAKKKAVIARVVSNAVTAQASFTQAEVKFQRNQTRIFRGRRRISSTVNFTPNKNAPISTAKAAAVAIMCTSILLNPVV